VRFKGERGMVEQRKGRHQRKKLHKKRDRILAKGVGFCLILKKKIVTSGK